MRMLSFYFVILIAAAAALLPGQTQGQDQALSLSINPLTGTASIRNDTASSVSIDGYLLTSPASVFNPGGWTPLTGNASFPGWAQGPAETNRMGEANLFSSLPITGGALIPIGSPYTPFSPIQIGQPEPGLKFEYSIDGVGSIEGDVVFEPQNNVVLLVNPATGAASLQNQSNFPVSIDGLLITSPENVLDPVGWNGLAENGVGGWQMGAAEINRLGEGNLFGSTLLPANGPAMDIGSAINPDAITDETDVIFEYHIAGGNTVTGGVVFGAAAAATLPGDFSGNGAVENADLTLLLNNWAQPASPVPVGWVGTPQPTAPAINNDELTALLNNWGQSVGGGSALSSPATPTSIPEPGTGTIGSALAIALAGYRRRRRNSMCSRRQAGVPHSLLRKIGATHVQASSGTLAWVHTG
jgi:hypothetical protein